MGPEALISAAQELLGTLPPAKVTRAAVARHAGVDPSLIRYYFSDRESLLLAVLRRIVTEQKNGLRTPTEGTAAERLRALVRAFFDFNAAHPYLHRLLIEEIARSKSKEARAEFHAINHGAIRGLSKIIKDGLRDGSLRRVDPVLLHVMVIGMCEFFFESRVLLEDALGRPTEPRALARRYADMISSIAVDGLERR